MSKQALQIEQYSSRIKKFGFNLTALKILASYCKEHPNKPGVLLYDNTKEQPMDPFLFRMKEKDKLLSFFRRFSLHGIVLVNVTADKYSYLGRYVNGTMVTLEIPKEKNGLHVPYLISVIFMMEEIEKDYLKNFKRTDIDKQIEDISSRIQQSQANTEQSTQNTDPALESATLIALENNLFPEQATPSASVEEQLEKVGLFQGSRQVSFKDLPMDLQQAIARDMNLS